MRKYGLAAIAGVALALCAAGVRGEDLTPAEKAIFEKQVTKLVKVEPTRLEGMAIDAVFSAKFYTVEVTVGGGMQKLLAAVKGDKLVDVSEPNTTDDVPAMVDLIKPGFKLSTDADAKVFQEALDKLFPIDDRFNKDDVKAKAFKHEGKEWRFIRGKFFDKFKGWVITTDAAGKVTGIKYSLEIPA